MSGSPYWTRSELMELKQLSIYQILIYTGEKQAYYLFLAYRDVIQIIQFIRENYQKQMEE